MYDILLNVLLHSAQVLLDLIKIYNKYISKFPEKYKKSGKIIIKDVAIKCTNKKIFELMLKQFK